MVVDSRAYLMPVMARSSWLVCGLERKNTSMYMDSLCFFDYLIVRN